jgi:hypothetical protein
MRRVLVAVVVLGALALVPSPSHAQELTEARLQAIEAASRGRSGCGEPELLAAIALYRDAPAGTVLRVRLAAFVQDGAFFAGKRVAGRSVSARVPTRAAPTSRTQKRSGRARGPSSIRRGCKASARTRCGT